MKNPAIALAFAMSAIGFGTAHAATELTTATPDNGSGGVYLTLTDLTAPQLFLEVHQIDIGGFTGTEGTNVDVEVYTRPGSYDGFETDPAGWTLTQTLNVTRAGQTTPVAMPLDTSITVGDGESVSIYLQTLASDGLRYTGTSGEPPQTLWSNEDVELFSDVGTTADTAFEGSLFEPRTFAGTIHYDVNVVPLPAPAFAGLALFGLLGVGHAVRRRQQAE